MKVKRLELLSCLRNLMDAVENKSIFVEYQAFHFYGTRVQASDGAIWIDAPLPEGLELNLSVTAASFYALLNKMADEDVEVVVSKGKVKISDSSSFGDFVIAEPKVTTLPDFPLETQSFDMVDLIDGMEFCKHGCSKDESTGPLTGVAIKNNTVWGCDRYRILKWNLATNTGMVCSIPKSVIGFLYSNKKNVEVMCFKAGTNYGGRFGVKLNGGTILWANAIEGEYKDLSGFFPNSANVEKIQLHESFTNILARHMTILSDVSADDKEVHFYVGKDSVKTVSKVFSVAGEEMRSLEEDTPLKAARTGPDLNFCVNPNLMSDVLGFCWEFCFFADSSVVLFESDKFKYLVKARR